MEITSFSLKNYRRLADVRLDVGNKTTVLVGANNSGKTSCIAALHTFLNNPAGLQIRDISKHHWKQIKDVGEDAKAKFPKVDQLEDLSVSFAALLPNLEVEITAQVNEANKVRDILPSLDWCGGSLFVRIAYEPASIEEMLKEYVRAKGVVEERSGSASLWPKDLFDFLEKGQNFNKYIKQKHYVLSKAEDSTTEEVLQPLSTDVLKKLIRVDVISEQRGLGQQDGSLQKGPYSEKQNLNKLLRSYYDSVLSPDDFPEEADLKVLGEHQELEGKFSKRLNDHFSKPFAELKEMGYPGIGGNPSVEISANISGADALQKPSSVRYKFNKNEEEFISESYLGLGYQNLIYLTFRLLEFRDKWLRVGKTAALNEDIEEQIEPIHLVLIEEPEVNLHAQVQRVFVKNAYKTLRQHDLLINKATKNEYQTQLVISTHSSHIVNDINFKDLRYFKRTILSDSNQADITSIANMSKLFTSPSKELLFVSKHLKLTHCDIFFADGVVFVEGQAERLLVPEFINKSFPKLASRYISLLEISGAHTHKYKDLIEKIGVATLVITDLDSVGEDKNSCYPQRGQNQKTSNSTLKSWHPKKETLDELMDLPLKAHFTVSNSAPLYIAYQKPVEITGNEVLARTFEDALILANFENNFFKEYLHLKEIITDYKDRALDKSLSEALYDFVKTLTKGGFAFNCLMHLAENDTNWFEPPAYIKDGLEWLTNQLEPKEGG